MIATANKSSEKNGEKNLTGVNDSFMTDGLLSLVSLDLLLLLISLLKRMAKITQAVR